MNAEELFDNYINGNMSYFATQIKKLHKKNLMKFLYYVWEYHQTYFFAIFSKVRIILGGDY